MGTEASCVGLLLTLGQGRRRSAAVVVASECGGSVRATSRSFIQTQVVGSGTVLN